jgi:hypothetical protein
VQTHHVVDHGAKLGDDVRRGHRNCHDRSRAAAFSSSTSRASCMPSLT